MALYAQGRGLRGAAVEAFVPLPDLRGQVPHQALHVKHHLRVWDGHPVGCTHVFKVRCETGVVTGEALVAKQTLKGRRRFLVLGVRVLVVVTGTGTAAPSPASPAFPASPAGRRLADFNIFLSLCVEFSEGDWC